NTLRKLASSIACHPYARSPSRLPDRACPTVRRSTANPDIAKAKRCTLPR
ncbi:hypothetical protein K443DRAFT_107978, partial [Laccaria amethystina LaAM-08-1]